MRKTLLFSSIVLQALVPWTSALNLQDNFQALTITVPNKCSQAYGQTLPGCTQADFGKTTSCSSACVAGLSAIAKSVNTACANVVVDSSTLLGRIFQGQIIPSLCPNNGRTTPSSSSAQASTQQSTVVATTKQSPSTTSAPAAASSTTEVGSSLSSAAPSSSANGASSSSTTTANGAVTSSAPPASVAVSSSTGTSSATSSTSAVPAAGGRLGLTVQQQQLQAGSNSGGGSPFDIVGYTSSARRLSENGVGMMLVGTTLLLAGVWM